MTKHAERTIWKEEAISAPVRAIGEKIRQHGKEALSEEEREAFATIDEAAYLASQLAGRPIAPRYIRSLRTTGRLKQEDTRPAGNTYLYKIGALVDLRFYQREQTA